MASKEIEDESRRYLRRCKSKSIFSFLSTVLVPILIGIFSIILTVQQKSIAEANREIDLRIAADQHRQNIELALDGQREAQLVAYMREMADLLLDNNFSLNTQILTSIVRPKTMAALRKLDKTRKVYLIRFLYESRLISTQRTSFLSLADADLSNIDLSDLEKHVDMRQVSLFGAHLDNSSFDRVSLGYSDFGNCKLRLATFHSAGLNNVNFDGAWLNSADFTEAEVFAADFSRAKLTNAKITQKQLERVISISGALMPDNSTGRNPNLFIHHGCQNLTNGNSIRQKISVRRYREWLNVKPRGRTLFYQFTGWFDHFEDVHVNFTEFDLQGNLLQQYCYGRNESILQCRGVPWILPYPPVFDHANQYQYLTERINCHQNTSTINVHINLGGNGTCRELYLSIET